MKYENEPEALLFYTESYYNTTDVSRDINNLLLRLEEEYLKMELVFTQEQQRQAERQNNEEEKTRLLGECQRIFEIEVKWTPKEKRNFAMGYSERGYIEIGKGNIDRYGDYAKYLYPGSDGYWMCLERRKKSERPEKIDDSNNDYNYYDVYNMKYIYYINKSGFFIGIILPRKWPARHVDHVREFELEGNLANPETELDYPEAKNVLSGQIPTPIRPNQKHAELLLRDLKNLRNVSLHNRESLMFWSI